MIESGRQQGADACHLAPARLLDPQCRVGTRHDGQRLVSGWRAWGPCAPRQGDRSVLPAVLLRPRMPGTAKNRREQPTTGPSVFAGLPACSRLFPDVELIGETGVGGPCLRAIWPGVGGFVGGRRLRAVSNAAFSTTSGCLGSTRMSTSRAVQRIHVGNDPAEEEAVDHGTAKKYRIVSAR